MSDSLFSSDLERSDTQYLWRLELADLLDVGISVLLGWGLLRALDVDRTVGTLILASLLLWAGLSTVSGLSGWTLGRGLVGLRLVSDGAPPGAGRGLARAVLALLQLPLAPILQRRPLDMVLKVHPVAVRPLSEPWRRGLGWQGLWLVLALGAVWFMVMPTPREALGYLHKLDGWRCCHSTTTPVSFQCSNSLSRVAGRAEGGNAQAQAFVAECPQALARMKH